jgi:predicted metal-dependent HD superfamily phosphohydrolase
MKWEQAVCGLGGDGEVAADAWGFLERQYGQPHRRYHTLRHAEAVAHDSAELARSLRMEPRDLATVVIAAWAHDVVYDAQPGLDEQRSFAWAQRWLDRAGVAEADIARVGGLILTTIRHDAPADDLLATALLDADLATLGAEPAAYDEYARGVREEYAKYPDDVWASGRADVLERLLAKTPLYRSEPARARWESAARRNLAGELTRWRAGGGDLG